MLFYSLSVSGSQQFMEGSIEVEGLSVRDQEKTFRGEVAPPDAIMLDSVGGHKLPDRLSAAFLTGVSPRMLAVFESVAATGYTTVPIILRHAPTGCVIHGYSGLVVTGRGGPLDEERMQPLKKSGDAIISCNGFYIFEDHWDGSDVFTIDGLGFNVWVTERVATALQKARPQLSNLHLTPNTQPS
ncbi:MAG: hypothetical protein JXQ73_31365 [Phycisphaerae bacterium]|nr:hypothetical protein [Phycisphaerae bacterium]